jgi:CHAD domain-containing protein
MSFELKPGVSLRKNIRRIVRDQLDDGLEHLTGRRAGTRDEAVHEARKSFKKVRAVLRLVRPAIGAAAYRAENACFRDAGRPLAEVRDAKVLIDTLDKLAEHFQEQLAGRSFDDTREALRANLLETQRRVLDTHDALAAVAKVVRKARRRVKDWADVPGKWWAVGDGLEDGYRRTRDAFRDAVADPTAETLHEWRKQAKYLRHQLEVLRPVWSERLTALADEADRMAERLGDDHDLSVLRQRLSAEPGWFGDVAELLTLIDRRRAELAQEFVPAAGPFFRDTPREFARRIKGRWKAWRTEAGPRQADDGHPAQA